jgi:predicted Zn-dependent peptidase
MKLLITCCPRIPLPPFAYSRQLLHEAAYGENTPLGSPVYAPDFDKVCAAEVAAYRKANFTGSRLTVTAVGNVSHDSLKHMIEYWTHGLSSGSGSANNSPYQGGDVRVRTDLGGKTYLGLGFPIPAGDAGEF